MSLITQLKIIDDTETEASVKAMDMELHNCLTDAADWDADFWDYESRCLEEYAEKLKLIFLESEHGFEFQALWVGDKPAKVVELPLEEFLAVVRGNKIGTKTKYVVTKHA